MLGQTEFLDDIQGLIQGEVGQFLQLKSQLQEMSRSPILTISDKSAQLMVVQNQLESELAGAIEKSKSGNLSDSISATGFFALMEKQIYDVRNLREEYIGLGDSAKASFFGGIPDWLLYAGGAFIILKVLMKKRKK